MENNVAPELGQASDALVTAYYGVTVKPGKGIAHAQTVASALRLARCSDAIVDYRPRKRALREQTARGGPDASPLRPRVERATTLRA